MVRVFCTHEFSVHEWTDFEEAFRPFIAAGDIHWEIDMTALPACNSRLIGLLIGFNTILITRQGELTLLVKSPSDVLHSLNLCKIQGIIPIREVTAEATA